MMSFAESPERPKKKRRFFVDDSPVQDHSFAAEPSLPDEINALPEAQGSYQQPSTTAANSSSDKTLSQQIGFDAELFASIIGEQLPAKTISTLENVSGGDVQRAINMYFDGSWKNSVVQPVSNGPTVEHHHRSSPKAGKSPGQGRDAHKTATLQDMPDRRYVGALGVIGWSTKSGTGLIKAEEKVNIERAQPQLPKGSKGPNRARRQDVIVRFTNSKEQEVGRLEQETAAWISALIDQRVCHFEGHCIYAPDRLRTNDTIYLQLRCFLRRGIFDSKNFIKPVDNNRQTGIFEAKETQEEQNLRMRQVGLVKLFHEINLHPTRVNETTEKHKREGILQAAELAEKKEKESSKTVKATQENGGSSPPSEDNEEGAELEQDQLDSLYKKAQSFDFDTPELQPASTFVMDLRKYQKQALHWMVGKETDAKSDHKEVSMHPLWEEYSWPTKDAEGNQVPQVSDQNSFYINPYSGELSLDFPVQEQNCLGGILADGKCYGLAVLIHTDIRQKWALARLLRCLA